MIRREPEPYRSLRLMAYDTKAVANSILFSVWNDGKKISPLKLQKLVYFSHGWSLGLFDKPLINEQVEAWPHGPVIASIYHLFKRFGNGDITTPARQLVLVDGEWLPNYPCIPETEGEGLLAKGIVDRVISLYGKFTALQLSTMTHAEGTPWYQVCKQHNWKPPKGTDIPVELIASHFKGLAGAGTQATAV